MINVTIGESKTQIQKKFPKLMINTDNNKTIILALSQDEDNIKGILLVSAIGQEIQFSDSFDAYCFTDYNEPITLQNA